MWPLFRPFPVIDKVALSTREIVATGALIQRELVDQSAFSSAAQARGGPSLDQEQLERWDQDGFLSPIAFVRGVWTSWHSTEPYPVEGIEFRDETGFRPWSDYLYEEEPGVERVKPLFSEWQLLYLPIAREATITRVPSEVLLSDSDRLIKWADDMRGWIENTHGTGAVLHERWLPTIKVLLRLQARHWPSVHGRSVLLRQRNGEPTDALDLELDSASAKDVLKSLGLSKAAVREQYEWFAQRAETVDPQERLYELLRLEPRRRAERDRGPRREALDLYDAAEIFRRFYRALTGELLPDVDQLHREPQEPRPFGREPGQLVQALRRARLYPHSLHMVVEGETEVRVIKRLFEAFAARPWEGAGLEITDLGGDKLESSRGMIEDFGSYADSVALLLDNENDVERVTTQLGEAQTVPDLHVHLCEPSLEEENFTPDELVQIAVGMAKERGHELRLTGEQLTAAVASHNQGRKRRKGMASVLVELARSPKHGPVELTKPDLGDAMAEQLLTEIKNAPGTHDEVAQRRPIVKWTLAYPLRAYRGSRT